jgi:3-keto-5-aminohexanoate cleavage enzyme
MILQFTTGNYAPNISERAKFLELRPEMASLTPGSVNFRASRPGKDTAKKYINTHEEIDFLSQKMIDLGIRPDVAIFDLSMIYATADLVRRGLVKKPMRLMFVLGGHMALEARRDVLEFLVKEAENQFGPPGDDSWTWCS